MGAVIEVSESKSLKTLESGFSAGVAITSKSNDWKIAVALLSAQPGGLQQPFRCEQHPADDRDGLLQPG
jgi:hypothetical protein